MDDAIGVFGAQYHWTQNMFSKAQRICYRTIWTESDWRNLANPAMPESLFVIPNDGMGNDMNSTGLYQQRKQWWGSVLGSMKPYTATFRFLLFMVTNTPDWLATDEPTVCQLTQHSEFDGQTIDPETGRPYVFAANYMARDKETNDLAADKLFFTHTNGGKQV